MPTLEWIGKDAVRNHHREVHYHLLHCDGELSAGAPGDGNLLVEGDNLLALKALLPYYAGKVKCIYIDPPYNTGTEDWKYNDNVNSPVIRRWLMETVKKDDLSRHDKWLCMMLPRLTLLREMLSMDGVMFMSIDDNESYHARSLLNEVFGEHNFLAELVWEKTRKNDARFFSVGHEYAIVYARSLATLRDSGVVWREPKPGAREVMQKCRELVELHGSHLAVIESELREWYKALPKLHPAKKLSRYKHIDRYIAKHGPWRDRDISWPGGGGPRYDVPHPITKHPCKVPERGWGFATSGAMQRQIDLDLVEFREDHTDPPFRKAHLVPIPDELDVAVNDSDEWEEGIEEAGMQVMPSVIYRQSQAAVKYLRKLMGAKVFNNPKDHEVIARFIRYCTSQGSGDIVLDSFAGSGTTGEAVLRLNAEDNGNRRFILVEMEASIARPITAERLNRVIAGSGDIPPAGSGFRFCTLGTALFDDEGKISERLRFSDLAHHIYFTETGEPLSKHPDPDSPLIGCLNGVSYFLLWNGRGDSVLDSVQIKRLNGCAGLKVVYAEACTLGPGTLKRRGIVFKQVPYSVKAS